MHGEVEDKYILMVQKDLLKYRPSQKTKLAEKKSVGTKYKVEKHN